jgi:serine protease
LLALPALASAQTIGTFSVSVPAAVDAEPAPLDRMILKAPDLFLPKGGILQDAINAKLAQLSAASGTSLTYVRTLSGGEWLVQLPQPLQRTQMDSLAINLKALDSSIKFVHSDVKIVAASVPNDPYFSQQWHYHTPTGPSNRSGVNLPPAWDSTRGAGSTVAVLDSGYLPHADLLPNILAGGYDFMSALDYDANNGRDADPLDPVGIAPGNGGGICARPCIRPATYTPWHGTHVAGTIAAVGNNGLGVAGVAFEAKLLPVRVIGPSGGQLSDIADAIRWTAGYAVSDPFSTTQFPDIGAPRAQIINMSLSSTSSGACPEAMRDAINAAVARNVTVVVAAGNNEGTSNYAPGNCPNVISVAALKKSGDKASYSNSGANIAIAAPGGEGTSVDGVLSTYNSGFSVPTSASSYEYLSGTSMAAPHVAGVAALIKSLRPAFTPAQVTDVIRSTARPFPAGSSCSSAICGTGMLDAGAAVASLGQPDTSLPLRPGLGGTWYTPSQPGQGFLIDIDRAQHYLYTGWYTFDVNGTAGPNAQQLLRWYSIQDSWAEGERTKTMSVYLNVGGRFDSLPATSPVVVGTATLSFQTCNAAKLQYSMTVDGQSVNGTIPLTRLTTDEFCESSATPSFSLTNNGINPSLNGAWYNPQQPGQGFQFNFAPRNNNYVYLGWYTYALDGQPGSGTSGQRWYSVQGNYTPGSRNANLGIFETTGGRFNQPTPVVSTAQIGTASLTFINCTTASLTYNIPGRPSRTIPLARLVGVYNCTP